MPGKCPRAWGKHGMKSISTDIDDLYPEEGLCEVKYLKSCTVSIFDRTLGMHCRKSELLLTFSKVAHEFSRLAVAGVGDRIS